MQNRAIIFDLDDTLTATGGIWKQAEITLLKAIGQVFRPEVAATYKGMNSLDVAGVIHRHYSPSISLADAQAILRNKLIELFEAVTLEPMPGAQDCVRRAAGQFTIAVASGSPLVAIKTALDRLGILDQFSLVLSSESVARGKPFPDVYLKAAEMLGMNPQNCEAVEDSAIGARSARAAGMKCYLIPSTPAAREGAGSGVFIFDSLDELFHI